MEQLIDPMERIRDENAKAAAARRIAAEIIQVVADQGEHESLPAEPTLDPVTETKPRRGIPII